MNYEFDSWRQPFNDEQINDDRHYRPTERKTSGSSTSGSKYNDRLPRDDRRLKDYEYKRSSEPRSRLNLTSLKEGERNLESERSTGPSSKHSSKQNSPSPMINNPKLLHLFDDDYQGDEKEKQKETDIDTIEENPESTLEKHDRSLEELKMEKDFGETSKEAHEEKASENLGERLQSEKAEENIKATVRISPNEDKVKEDTTEELIEKDLPEKQNPKDTKETESSNEDTKEEFHKLSTIDAKDTSADGGDQKKTSFANYLKLTKSKSKENDNEDSNHHENSKPEEDEAIINLPTGEQPEPESTKVTEVKQQTEQAPKVEVDINAETIVSGDGGEIRNTASSSSLSSISDKRHIIGEEHQLDLSAISEDKKLEENDEDEETPSELETVITDSPPKIREGRKLIRKKDFDEANEAARKRQRTRQIFSSDDESENESESSASEKEDVASSKLKDGKKSNKRPEIIKVRPLNLYKIKRDSSGRSLLQRACKKGDLAEVKKYISMGANANESDFGGFTCLHEAALAGHTEVVKFLIENGADVNKQAKEAGDSETPLMDAAENKHLDTVKVLLENGADPQIYNSEGYSALTKIYHLHADEDGYEEIISSLEKALDESGVPVNNTSIPLAPSKIIEDPYEEYFNDLLKKKSPATTIYKYVAQGLKEAAASDFLAHNFSLQTKPDIFNLAAREGQIELVDILLGLNPGAFDINQKNQVGLTVLLCSVGRGNYEVVKFLLSKGADPSIVRKVDGLNSLEIARYSAHYDPREVELLQDAVGGKTLGDKPKENRMEKPEKGPVDKAAQKPEKAAQKSSKLDENDSINEKKRKSLSEESSSVKKMKKSKSREPEIKTKSTSPPELHKAELKKVASNDHHDLKKVRSTDHHGAEKSKSDDHHDFKKSRYDDHDDHKKTDYQELKTQWKDPVDSPPRRPKLDSNYSDKELNSGKTRTTSPSPAPLTKAQEEQKTKMAEEARVWQEKVEAKKKARKEFFIKAEKEKERKRKEEEEKKIEELKKQKLLEQEEKAKQAEKIAEENRQIELRRKELETERYVEHYPAGLRYLRFGEPKEPQEILKFLPLYTFDIDGEKYVLDLQVALITSTATQELGAKLSSTKVVTDEQKSKSWQLFYPMVGVDLARPFDNLRYEGHKKFKSLLLHYLKLSDVKSLLEKEFAHIHDLIWTENRLTPVDLSSMLPFDENRYVQSSNFANQTDDHVDPETIRKSYFIPPKLRLRQDVLKTVKRAKTPIW